MKQILLVLLLFYSVLFVAQNSWLTPYEMSNKTETASYQEIVAWCHQLDSLSEQISCTSIGKSGNGFDIPILILDANGMFNPTNVRNSGNAVLLIQAGIHAGEPDGTDAGLMLFRDFAIGKIPVPQHVTVLFIPTISPDGCLRRSAYNRINQNGPVEMGWRTTADYHNLNRDFLKAESVEIRAWHKMFQQWLPDFFIDCHTTDGADYQYVITYDLTCLGNMMQAQNVWQNESYLVPLKNEMESAGFPMFRYVSFRNWHDPRSGLISWIASPMLGEGYSAAQNRPGLLIETHMLKPYCQRVDGTYQMVLSTIDILDKEYLNITKLNVEADNYSCSYEFLQNPMVVSFKAGNDSSLTVFKGVEYTIEKSELTEGNWFKYTGVPQDFNIVHFDTPEPDDSITFPEAYVFLPVWKNVVELLDIHGISYYTLDVPKNLTIEAYSFNDVVFSDKPYEGRQRIVSFTMDTLALESGFPAGSIVVPVNQRTSRVIAHLLEPMAPSSLLRWGFFNRVFEQKEYAESYVMEVKAREMLDENPKLKQEFEQFCTENPDIIDNQRAILNWFYQRTEYWDSWKNVYPVFRYTGDLKSIQ